MNFTAVYKKVRRRICVWSDEEQCYIHSHDEFEEVPHLRKSTVDPNLILDVEGEDITLTTETTENNQLTENNNDD